MESWSLSAGTLAAAMLGMALLSASAGAQTLLGDEPSYLDLALGAFNALDAGNGAMPGHDGSPSTVKSRPLADGQIEFRYGGKLFFLGPAIGVVANVKGGGMIYAGPYADVALGPVIITPFSGIGGYRQGQGKDLGNDFEFHLSLSARYELPNGVRVGVQFAHTSNADTGRINPGDEELLATVSIPIRF